MADLITLDELIAAVPIPGARPDVTLKRLRKAGLVVAPKRPGQGRGKGRAALYPRETIVQVREIFRLRRVGIRSMRELRWALWWAGDNTLWPPVQRDLLASFPRAEQAAVDELTGTDALLDQTDRAAIELGSDWRGSRHRVYDRRRVRSQADVQTITHTLISAAADPGAPGLDDPVEDEDVTKSALIDKALGAGAAVALASAVEAGVTDASTWEQSLAGASAANARRVANLWRRTFEPLGVAHEFRFFGRKWGDRALMFAASARAVEAGLVRPD